MGAAIDPSSFLFDGPARAGNTVILAHGAGAPMDSEFMERLATLLAAATIRVVRFEFPYMAERRRTGKLICGHPFIKPRPSRSREGQHEQGG